MRPADPRGPKLARRAAETPPFPLGTDDSDTEVALAAHCGAVLVAGTSGGGKSTFTTAVLEQLIDAGYQVCIVDPEGDYQHFEQAAVLGTSDNFPAVEEVLEVLHEPRQSVVVNLLALGVAERPAFAGELLPELLKLRSATGRPHWIVIDEAHHLLPREWQAADTFVPDELTGYLLITVHPEQIATTVLETVETMIAIGSDPYRRSEISAAALADPCPRLSRMASYVMARRSFGTSLVTASRSALKAGLRAGYCAATCASTRKASWAKTGVSISAAPMSGCACVPTTCFVHGNRRRPRRRDLDAPPEAA